MKHCNACGLDKELDSFHLQSRSKDGRQSSCKECRRDQNHKYYVATPERNTQRAAANARLRVEAREMIVAYLTTHPCVDCGETDPVVLEFDHVRGDKLFNVSNGVRHAMCIATVEAEIQKCEVRCCNCHRRVTAQRGNWHWFSSPALAA